MAYIKVTELRKTPVARFFDAWATKSGDSYQQCMAEYDYNAPYLLVDKMLQNHNPSSILELACGTGIIGQQIKKKVKSAIIDGMDFSQAMMDQILHGTYRDLIVGDICAPQTVLPHLKQYDTLISCGVFGDFLDCEHLQPYIPLLAQKAAIAIAGDATRPYFFGSRLKNIEALLKTAGFTQIKTSIEPGYQGRIKPVKFKYVIAKRE